MPTRNKKITPAEMEKKLHKADLYLNALLPQNEEELREAMQMYGTTPVNVPERLRSGKKVLEKIKQQEPKDSEPSAFGKLLMFLRTKNNLSIQQLSELTGICLEEIEQIEADSACQAKPFAISVLAKYFRLQPQKLAKVARATRVADEAYTDQALQVAACAKPVFNELTRQEKRVFQQFLKQLR